jgi:hypothetical protein
MISRRTLAFAVALAGWFSCGDAAAYKAQSAISEGCHERLLFAAIRQLRAEGLWASVAPDPSLVPALDDLPFDAPDDIRGDLAAVALVLGVRDNDFKGNEATDAYRLGRVHADPTTQFEHCLRAPGHDEPGGSGLALVACRSYIQGQLSLALDSLDAQGKPDPTRRDSLLVYLNFAGQATLSLPRFHVRLGQALHALEDGFAHSYRTADSRRVTVVLNYIDYANDRADEARDGPPHSAGLDACSGLGALQQTRYDVALEATVALLRVALDSSITREAREQQASGVLTDYLSLEPGCTHDNRWCDAPEPALDKGGCGCDAAGRGGGEWAALGALGLVLGAALGRRGRRTAGAVLAAGLLARPARAEDPVPSRIVTEPAPLPEMPEGARFGLHLAGSAALDNAALAADAGLRYRVAHRWLIGLDGEWNPWLSVQTRSFAAGTANLYATLIRRWPLRPYDLKLRTSAHAGVSVLLFDLYGAPEGSIGPYFGANFLGLEYEISPNFSLIIDPADVALATPQARGAILMYRQYRFTVGLQFGG